MARAKGHWLQREREKFLAKLAETGDPAAAAAVAGKSVDAAYRLREAETGFGADWQRAIGAAWDQVDARMLKGLLAVCEPGKDDKPVDSRVALAILQRRDRAEPVRRVAPTIDGRRVALLREEIARLAKPRG